MLLMVAGLAGGASIIRSKSMENSKKRFKSFAEFPKLLGEQDPPLDGGERRSLPVPARRQNQFLIAIMSCPASIRPDPVPIMWPPSEVAWLDPTSGKLITSVKVSPADFGQTHSVNKPLKWEEDKQADISVESFLDLEDRLFALYDVLFEIWATNPSTRSSALQSAAREFLKIFDQISEPPLRPYYDALGREYFEWVRALAK